MEANLFIDRINCCNLEVRDQDFDGLGVMAACAGTGEVRGVAPLHNGRVNSANANFRPASARPAAAHIITGITA